MTRERKVHRLPIKEHPTTLACALAHCPGYHAFWTWWLHPLAIEKVMAPPSPRPPDDPFRWWLVSLCHLRPTENFPPAHLFTDGMTHEISIQVIDPERCPSPDPAAWEQGYPVVSPPSVVAQFAAQDDASALQIFEALCRGVAEGLLSPGTDYRRAWASVIQNRSGGPR